MIYRTREGEMVRNGINLDWGQKATFFRFILCVPFFRSHKFYKAECFDTKNYCLMKDEYGFHFYFRIRSKWSRKQRYGIHPGSKMFTFDFNIYKRPYYSKVIATREQLRDYTYA